MHGTWVLMRLQVLTRLVCVIAAAFTGKAAEDISFTAIHAAERTRNHILASFRTPDSDRLDGATEARLVVQFVHTQELRIIGGGSNNCSAVVAAVHLVIRGCTLAADRRSIGLSLFEPLQRNTSYAFELQVENRAALGVHFCQNSSILGKYFVKTGGWLNETTPPGGKSVDRELDRCCRKTAGTCHTFDSADACEAAKADLPCLACAAGAKNLGCPRAEEDIAGYHSLRERAQCRELIPSGTVATAEDCADACSNRRNCTAFTLWPGGLCFLSLGPCCPGDNIKNISAVSYFRSGSCGITGSWQWRVSLSLHWRDKSGREDTHKFAPVEIAAGAAGSSGTMNGLRPSSHPAEGSSVASFSAVPLPDVGLLSAGDGAFATVELEFKLGLRGESPGDLLLFVPLPMLPWNFGVSDGTPLLASSGATDYLSTAAAVIETDLPDVLSCVWHRIGNSGGANSIRCVATESAVGLLGSRSHRIILQLPVPHAAGFSTDWLLYVQSAEAASVATQSDVPGFVPVGAGIEMIMSAVQLPQSLTTILLSFQLGMWSNNLELTVTAPDYILRNLQECGAADGWPFPVASRIVIQGTSCRFEGVVTGEPSTTYRLQLASENRGVMPGSQGVFTLSLRWEKRHVLVSAKEFYNIVEPFSQAGVISALSVRGAVGPVIIYFDTAASRANLYEGCQYDMELQVTLLRPLLMVIRSTTGQPLSASGGPAECGEILVETYSDGSNGFPAPASCRWDAMTSRGHFFAMSFNSSAGYEALQSGQRVAIVMLAELVGVDEDTVSSETASSSVLTLMALCGDEAVEAAQLRLSKSTSQPFEVFEPFASGATLSLLGSPVANAVSITYTLRVERLQASSTLQLESFRVLALPLFGFRFQGASIGVKVQGWRGGAVVLDQTVTGAAKRVGGDWAPQSLLDIPHNGAEVDTIQLEIPALSPQGAGLGWTGFAAHPYVFFQLLGRQSGRKVGDTMQLNKAAPDQWLAQEPSLKYMHVIAQSQMGGALHRVDMLLQLGFLARGIKVTVTAPQGISINGHGPPPATVTYLNSKGHATRHPQMRVNMADATYAGNTASLPVSNSIMWPTTTYAYSLQVANPAVLLEGVAWLVTVEYSLGYAVAGGAVPTLRSVPGTAGHEEGAFAVVPALQACSVSPVSMELGAKNAIHIFFTVSADTVISIDYTARPFVMKLFAPPAFAVYQPIVFEALVNLPPLSADDACSAPHAWELHCRLPGGFAFVSGATYAFKTCVQNPRASKVEEFSSLRELYTPTWALRLEYSQMVLKETTSLYSLCEGIPRSPLRGADGELAFPEPFSLYIAETQPLFFGVSVATLLPYGLSGTAPQVAVTFQPISAQLPSETILLATAPVGWQWDRSSDVDGKSTSVRRGTTRNLEMIALSTAPEQANRLSLRLTSPIIEGQVYGFLSHIRVPNVEANDARSEATANMWTLEFLRESSLQSLASDGHFEAVTRSFTDERIRRVTSCMALPMTPDAGAETDIIIGFKLASAVKRRGYIAIQTPLQVEAVEPCDEYLSHFVPLPRDLPKSGYVYPEFVPLPSAVTCSWGTGVDGTASLNLINQAEEQLAPRAYLISVRIRVPSANNLAGAQAAHSWHISTHANGGELLDAACDLQKPFRLVTPTRSLVSAAVMDTKWYDPAEPLMIIGFTLAEEVSSPIVLTLRAPFGFRFGDISCRRHVVFPYDDSASPEALLSDSTVSTCIAGGGSKGSLGQQTFAPDAGQPSPLLEGTLSFEVSGDRLQANKEYVFGVSLVSPIGVPLQRFNTWYVNVGDQSATIDGQDLMRVTSLSILASFPGFALGTASLPYNDVSVSFIVTAKVLVTATTSLILSVPDVFMVSMEPVTCAPFTDFSAWGADVCMLGRESVSCASTSCVTIRPNVTADSPGKIWLDKNIPYQFQIRVQNPANCEPCATTWHLQFRKENVEWTSTAEGFALVGGVGKLSVHPSHQLGGVRVLLAVHVAFTGTLRLHDRVKFLIPEGWQLDPEFCTSPLGQASIIGLNAPPECTEEAATLTVYEMDLPPIHQMSLRLNLEATAPLFEDWKQGRVKWLSVLNLADSSTVPAATQVPLEFAIIVYRGSGLGANAVKAPVASTVSAAAKVQAYELLPNMAQGAELQVSTALLSERVALRVSFTPSSDVNVRSNSVLLRASLPYDFSSCQLLWEEEPERKAERPRSDPAFMFAGEPRCNGKLHEAELLAVLLDTTNKRPVTLYVANFTAPAPPYAAAQSSWEIVLQRSRGTLEPIRLDTALGVKGLGAFGDVRELMPTSENGGFASNFAFGAINTLTFIFYVTVQLLLGSVVRVIAPPGFVIDPFSFRGVTRHFARQWAASDVWLNTMRLQEYYGPAAPKSVSVQVLQVRALTDSAVGEELHFEVKVRNPDDTLTPELQLYNRWILETLDVSSNLVVNSNRMSWRTFNPMPAFIVMSLVSRNSIAAFSDTTIDMELGVDALVNISTSADLILEILAPDSFLFNSTCFDETQQVNAKRPRLPFAESCQGIGRLAIIRGKWPAQRTMWARWPKGSTYALSLQLTNGDSTREDTVSWACQLRAATSTESSIEAPAQAASNATSTLTESQSVDAAVSIGPAQAVLPTNVRLWSADTPGGGAMPSVEPLDAGARLLVIERSWAQRKGMSVGAGEVAVLLPEGRFGVTASYAVQNVPADDAVPTSTFEYDVPLVRPTRFQGYALESIVAAAGYGSYEEGLSGFQMVVVVQLTVATGFPLAGVRVAAPPHMLSTCEGATIGNLPARDRDFQCRIVRDAFTTTSLFSFPGECPESSQNAITTSCYLQKEYFWFAAPMEMLPKSNWAPERQTWEVGIVDTLGQMRFVTSHLQSTPRNKPNSTLLFFRVQTTSDGDSSTEFGRVVVKATLALRQIPQEKFGSSGIVLRFRTSSQVPIYRETIPRGPPCLVPPLEDAMFKKKPYEINPGSEATCTLFDLTFSRPGGGGDASSIELAKRDAEGGVPARYEFTTNLEVMLWRGCRRPNPACADFFSVTYQDEELIARDNGLEQQLAEGLQEIPSGAPSQHRPTPQAVTLGLMMLALASSWHWA